MIVRVVAVGLVIPKAMLKQLAEDGTTQTMDLAVGMEIPKVIPVLRAEDGEKIQIILVRAVQAAAHVIKMKMRIIVADIAVPVMRGIAMEAAVPIVPVMKRMDMAEVAAMEARVMRKMIIPVLPVHVVVIQAQVVQAADILAVTSIDIITGGRFLSPVSS